MKESVQVMISSEDVVDIHIYNQYENGSRISIK